MSLSALSTSLFEPWLQYQNPLVRQLAFCIASPNILQHIPNELEVVHAFQLHYDAVWHKHWQNYHPRLLELDQKPEELGLFLQKLKSTRLGLRFEMFIWFWLLDQKYHPYQLLGHSIQKIDGPRTLGELDFVLLNTETQEIEHWEVALKYYLAERDFSLAYWYGLNRSDTLARKLNHFSQKQFQFNEALGQSIQRRFCVLKGQLYLPLETNMPLPNWVNPQRRIGQWGHQIAPQLQSFYRLQRSEWICPQDINSSEIATWWTDGLYKHIAQESYYMYRLPRLVLPQ
ncbi:hypothetical protein B9T33_15240 [Acinetobacter sp. ANC 5054]|uniref:DUF1853 family protein n=1 Tax=Acinetobacter sp. ANC 5054 TaxID=1977877 RepID=UPI000A34853F|nr:DUF1853 family protein [Acinetobacter sp. ANC 5054]OTG77280.1 hypothetical protein B9T33_15240 [Acinetobacter sp. ANC 5054]